MNVKNNSSCDARVTSISHYQHWTSLAILVLGAICSSWGCDQPSRIDHHHGGSESENAALDPQILPTQNPDSFSMAEEAQAGAMPPEDEPIDFRFPCEAVAPESAFMKPGLTEEGDWLAVDGRYLKSAGRVVSLEGAPGNVLVHPVYAMAYVVSSSRDDRRIYVINLETAEIEQDLVPGDSFYGLILSPDGTRLYASSGKLGRVDVFEIDPSGLLQTPTHFETGGYPAGLAISADGARLWVGLYNQSQVVEIDTANGTVIRRIPLSSLTWDLAYLPETGQLLITDLSGSGLMIVDDESGEQVDTIELGLSLADIEVDADGGRVWIAMSGDSQVATLDLTTLEVRRIDPVVPPDDHNELGNRNVNALVYDEIREQLLVSRSSENAISVLSVPDMTFVGAIPAGGSPTALSLSQNNSQLIVSEARSRTGPNEGNSSKNVVGGSLSIIRLADRNLEADTNTVSRNFKNPQLAFPFHCDGFFPIPTKRGQRSPMEHVILLVKENKTFDCVFGDLDDMDVDADPSLVRYGEELTPNLHALARQFNVSDNFYVEAEESDSGHIFLTSGHFTEFVQRIWVEKDRSRLINQYYQAHAAIVPEAGNLFSHLLDHDIDIKIYGEIVGLYNESRNGQRAIDFADLNFPGGIAANFEIEDEVKARYIIDKIESGDLASFTYILLPNDHTKGTSEGYPTPESMVADNDYAVGLLIEALAASPFWEKSVVLIVQDDPQGCEDHVDSHRSFVMAIGPWAKRGFVSHAHGSFVSVFATIFRILGVPPLGVGDATASPLWDLFTPSMNTTPFTALERRIPKHLNGEGLPGARASSQMDFRSPDRNPGLWVILDAYRLWRMGRISRGEAESRIENPPISLERWWALIEESYEERFAYDAALRQYREWQARYE